MSSRARIKFNPFQPAVSPDSSAVLQDGNILLSGNKGHDTATSEQPEHPLVQDSFSVRDEERYLPDNKLNHGTMGRLEDASKIHPLPIVLRHKPLRIKEGFIPLQKWEGTVLEVIENSFIARLIDQTSGAPDEEAEFPFEEISDDDLPLIEPGAIFYWNIGYTVSPSGQRTRSSLIRFRRLPAWTEGEIKEARREAERLSDILDWK